MNTRQIIETIKGPPGWVWVHYGGNDWKLEPVEPVGKVR